MGGKYLQLTHLGVAVPLVRFEPHRVRRTIGIAKPGNGRRVNFNFSARSFNGLACGSARNAAKREKRALSGFSGISLAGSLARIRQTAAASLAAAPTLGGNLVEGLQPLQIVFPSVKRSRPPASQRSLRSAKHRNRRALHRAARPPASSAPDADCCSRRSWSDRYAQTKWSPVRRYQHGAAAVQKHSEITISSGFCRLNQAVGILMMGKVGAARPPDKADVGKAPRHPVVLIACAGVFQASTMRATGIFPPRLRRPLRYPAWRPAPRRGAWGCRRWQSGKKDQNRRRACQSALASPPASPASSVLLAKLLALHAPAGHQHGGVFVEKFRQFADFSAATPQIAAAHSAVLATPSLSPLK